VHTDVAASGSNGQVSVISLYRGIINSLTVTMRAYRACRVSGPRNGRHGAVTSWRRRSDVYNDWRRTSSSRETNDWVTTDPAGCQGIWCCKSRSWCDSEENLSISPQRAQHPLMRRRTLNGVCYQSHDTRIEIWKHRADRWSQMTIPGWPKQDAHRHGRLKVRSASGSKDRHPVRRGTDVAQDGARRPVQFQARDHNVEALTSSNIVVCVVHTTAPLRIAAPCCRCWPIPHNPVNGSWEERLRCGCSWPHSDSSASSSFRLV
jgi:hypothetical protein